MEARLPQLVTRGRTRPHAAKTSGRRLQTARAKSFASRHRGSLRFLNGFLAGAVVGAAGAGLTVLQLLRRRDGEPHGEYSGGRHPQASAGSHVTALRP